MGFSGSAHTQIYAKTTDSEVERSFVSIQSETTDI